MQQNDLSGVKVGDTLFHVRYEWCAVVDVNRGTHHPIYIRIPSTGYEMSFTNEGKEYESDFLPTLFLSKPTIIYPPPPVEKEVKGWVGFFVSEGKIYPRMELYVTEAEANFHADKDPSLPRAVWVCHKYRGEVKDE